jgi:segregation and condensation protein B
MLRKKIQKKEKPNQMTPNNDIMTDNLSEVQTPQINFEEALEAILYAAGHPVTYEKLASIFQLSPSETKNRILKYAQLYNEGASIPRGIIMLTFDDSCQLCTKKEYIDQIREALGIRRNGNLSASSIETLAIIAYNQPVTRAYIDTVRGVDSSYSVTNLLERGLIEAKGRLDAPGRPMLYGTSTNFLRCFGLTSLGDLPGVNSEEAAEMLKRMEEQLSSQMPDKNQLTLDESIELALAKTDSEATDEVVE